MSRSRLFFPARVRKGGSGSHRRKEVHAHQNFKEAEQIINHINMTSLTWSRWSTRSCSSTRSWWSTTVEAVHQPEADDRLEAVHQLEADGRLEEDMAEAHLEDGAPDAQP